MNQIGRATPRLEARTKVTGRADDRPDPRLSHSHAERADKSARFFDPRAILPNSGAVSVARPLDADHAAPLLRVSDLNVAWLPHERRTNVSTPAI